MTVPPRLQLALISDGIAQQPDRRVVIIGPVHELSAFVLPFIHTGLVVTLWVDGQGTFQQRVRIVGPDGSVTDEVEAVEMDLGAPDVAWWGAQTITLQFEQEGPHRLQVYLDSELAGDFPLIIRRVDPPEVNLNEGILVQVPGEPPVYRIEKDRRRHVPDPETFQAMALRWKDVRLISRQQLDRVPLGDAYPSRRNGPQETKP